MPRLAVLCINILFVVLQQSTFLGWADDPEEEEGQGVKWDVHKALLLLQLVMTADEGRVGGVKGEASQFHF